MWAHIRILRVSWTERKTNQEVLKMANRTSPLLPTGNKSEDR